MLSCDLTRRANVKMFYLNYVRNFAKPIRILLKNNGLGASFSNYRTIVPLSTTKLALKDEKLVFALKFHVLTKFVLSHDRFNKPLPIIIVTL